MSQRETTTRHHLIINKLRRAKQATFNEIADYLALESKLQDYDFNISKRTFQRDVKEIASIYGIFIKYDMCGKFWFIEKRFAPENDDHFFEALDVYHVLKAGERNKSYIFADEKPQNVVLSFLPLQGNYIKSLPLHETQKILIDNEKELRISLNIHITNDFKMEILSYGENVKVLEPQSFTDELRKTYSMALKQYL